MKTKFRPFAALLLSLLLVCSLFSCALPSEAEIQKAVDSAGKLAEEIEAALNETDEIEENSSRDAESSSDLTDTTSDTTSFETFSESEEATAIDEDGTYTSKEDVALYLFTFGHLPKNYITKDEARALGWNGGSLEPYSPGSSIGGDRFGNREGLLPRAKGRQYYECDIDTLGAKDRGAKRIVYSNDGLIYYTEDHYESFTLLYGEE